MDIGQANSLLEQFTYKPGWRFKFVEGRHSAGFFDDIPWLHVTFNAPDATGAKPGLIEMHGRFEFMLSRFADSETFWRALDNRVRQIENHEIDEWFRINRVCLNEPH